MGTGYGKVCSLPLPSGNKVRVKRASLLTLVRTGQIPPRLISAVWTVFGNGTEAQTPAIPETDRVKTMIELMDQAIKAILVDVKLVDGGTQSETTEDKDGFMIGEVNVADIPDGDKALLFGYAQGVVNADPVELEVSRGLETFPAQSTSATPGPGSEAIRTAPESIDTNQPVESVSAGV